MTFDLGHNEADYLRDQIQANAPASFLDALVGRDPAKATGNFAVEHPAANDTAAVVRQMLDTHLTFSELMHQHVTGLRPDACACAARWRI